MLRTAVRDVFRRLLDAVDPELVDAAEAALAAEPGVTAVRSVKMIAVVGGGHRRHPRQGHPERREQDDTADHSEPGSSSIWSHETQATRAPRRSAHAASSVDFP